MARSHGYSGGAFSTHNFCHADGNGNVTYLISPNQIQVAEYRYDPYGNTLSSGGTLATANTYRFSSKEQMPNSGLYYYGYRFYDPNLQRWLNRDPLADYAFFKGYVRHKPWHIKERIRTEGLQNAYRFLHNSPLRYVDMNGLEAGYIYLPDGTMKPPIDHVPGEACVGEIQNAIEMFLGNAGYEGYPIANDDDKLQHCITSCRISRACGKLSAWALGQLKESSDLIHGGSGYDTAEDLDANQVGRNGRDCSKSCEDHCQENRNKY